MERDLPDFGDPPVVEVILGVQFDAFEDLNSIKMGVLWNKLFQQRFPIVEEHGELAPQYERFGVPRGSQSSFDYSIMLQKKPPSPRAWFLKDDKSELLQIQRDRFIHNWRKLDSDSEYPRYENVRETFSSELENFREYCQSEKLGELNPNQCEISYLNHISLGDKTHSDLSRILTVFQQDYSDQFLRDSFEESQLHIRYLIKNEESNPVGRLHIKATPVVKLEDKTPIYSLELTARGQPDGNGIEGVLKFLNRGREWIVKGFAAITTKEMHKIWKRKDSGEE
ncbi:MAG: hypothetical protein Tsb009_01530 [Planctomycetaceae bacterium]